MTTNEFMSFIAQSANIPLKQAKTVWADIVDNLVTKELKKTGECKLPGIAKLVVRKIPARKACTKMVLGQMRDLPAKPASKKVKARVLKTLADSLA
jgi:nucleoid DNA-binding protein